MMYNELTLLVNQAYLVGTRTNKKYTYWPVTLTHPLHLPFSKHEKTIELEMFATISYFNYNSRLQNNMTNILLFLCYYYYC